MYLRARQYGISYLPQEASVFRKLTVEENILAVLEAQPISWHERREKMEKLIDELGLEHIAKIADMLSPGESAGAWRSPAACASTPHSFCWTNRFLESIHSRTRFTENYQRSAGHRHRSINNRSQRARDAFRD